MNVTYEDNLEMAPESARSSHTLFDQAQDLGSQEPGTFDQDDSGPDAKTDREPSTDDAPVADINAILKSIRSFEEELTRNREEIGNQRELLELLGADTWSRKRQADESAFMREIRETFEKDPAQATSNMIKKAQEQMWQAFENRLNQEAGQKAAFDQFMEKLVSNPEKASMGKFRDEIEFLVRNKGIEPGESIGLIEKIAGKFNRINDRKQAAIKKMRSESQFESSGRPDSRDEPDLEFTRLMSQAANLDEMFANLRKLNH